MDAGLRIPMAKNRGRRAAATVTYQEEEEDEEDKEERGKKFKWVALLMLTLLMGTYQVVTK